LDRVFEVLPVLELAAASLHGEQAAANLLKIRHMAEKLADRPHLSFSAFVDVMIGRLAEQPEEAESALAEESLEAVRVLTIHKAKGLEFPVVILPGLHQGTGGNRVASPVFHDWATGVFGITFGEKWNLGALLTDEKAKLREEAERRRLLYVGMTRARERLVLSGGLPARPAAGTFMGLLKAAVGDGVGEAGRASLRIGTVPLAQTVVTVSERPPRHRERASLARLQPSLDWSAAAARWAERDRVWAAVRSRPTHVTPTGLQRAGRPAPARAPAEAADAGRGRLIGTLAHRVLQSWEFSQAPDGLAERIARVCRLGLPPEWAERAAEIERDLQELFQAFIGSEPYRDLQRATILAREVPFVMAWDSAGEEAPPLQPAPPSGRAACVMEGVIDVIYRLDGRLYLADYKTDRVEDGGVAARAEEYNTQARIYREAVARCLGTAEVEVRLIFVRYGQAVSA
jgi:ATP-dependent helicase/nuclease subunit A